LSSSGSLDMGLGIEQTKMNGPFTVYSSFVPLWWSAVRGCGVHHYHLAGEGLGNQTKVSCNLTAQDKIPYWQRLGLGDVDR